MKTIVALVGPSIFNKSILSKVPILYTDSTFEPLKKCDTRFKSQFLLIITFVLFVCRMWIQPVQNLKFQTGF